LGSIVLNQNVPNPFAEQTTISYSINEDFSKAQILFYDANDRLIQVTDIAGKGFVQLSIFADDLTTGVYSYALVVDGKVIETKKIVKE
jgi:trimeric autotransporter adhesin